MAKKPAKARVVVGRKSRKPGFSTDAEEVEARRLRAETEAALVERVAGAAPFYGVYRVHSTQWSEPYRVEIRALDDRLNSCLCPDFFMSGLGTCKHIERVLQHISKRKKRAFARAAAEGPPTYEVFLDLRSNGGVVRLLSPRRASRAARRLLDPFFGGDGLLLGDAVDAVPALRRAVEASSSRLRQRVRISESIEPWRERLQRRAERERERAAFIEDARRGKRTLNPVGKPLYPYQREGMLHLAFGRRALLADEMGLGKTVQAIAACELLEQLHRVRRVLIVCPASLKAEWEEQIRLFTGRAARLLYGPRAERLRVYREGAFYLVANYEQVRPDVEDINRYLAPDVVILDEAQRIKNWPTKTAKAIKRLQSPYAFVLTGTPLENRIEEVYSLVEFLDPLLFGALFRFQREFMQVDEEGRLSERNLPELHERVNAVMLRRRKADVEGELPARTNKTYFVPMEKEQRLRYEEYELRANRLIAQAQKRPLRKEEFERLQRLLACMRMVCDTPYILDQGCRICPKLTELEAILDEILDDPATKVLVFSEWVKMLDLVRELAREKGLGYAVHTGRLDQRKRREEIRRFKDDPACRLFLSSESGGSGLNLQVANVVINLDLPWNPAKLEQRVARAWRKHQTRPVTVMNLVTEHSIEHGMLGKLAFKRQLADSVLDGKAFEGRVGTARGRKHFLEQVSELMGKPLGGTAGTAGEAAPAGATPFERLKQDVRARFPSQVLGIEAAPEREAYLIITRNAEEADEIRAVASRAVEGRRVEVLDRAAYELLQRLCEQGVIAFTTPTESLYRAADLTDRKRGAQRRPARYPQEARAHFAGGARKRKMVRLLAGGGLHAEAVGPAAEVFDTALEALYLYRYGRLSGAALNEAAVSRLQIDLDLPFDAPALHEELRRPLEEEADAVEVVRACQEALDQVEVLLEG